MAYAFNPKFRYTICSNDLVLLDLVADEFRILPDVTAHDVNQALGGSGVEQRSPIIDALRSLNAIIETKSPAILVAHEATGFFDQRWMLPSTSSSVAPGPGDYLSCLWEVARTNFVMRRTSLEQIERELARRNLIDCANRVNSHEDRLSPLMSALNASFIFDTTGNKCLTYAYILTRLARRQKVPARLVVGVRTRPFFSHAWVEVGNTVINDDPQLRKKMAVILEA